MLVSVRMNDSDLFNVFIIFIDILSKPIPLEFFNLFCRPMPTIEEPMVKRSTFLFFHWNGKCKINDPVIISSLAFTPETQM